MIILWLTAKRKQLFWRKKTHTACSEQVGVCVPAQINIWLTPQSRFYLTDISERGVTGLSPFRVYPSFSVPFPISYRGQEPSLSPTGGCQLAWFFSKMRKKQRARIDEIINRDNNRRTTTHQINKGSCKSLTCGADEYGYPNCGYDMVERSPNIQK